MRAIALAAVLAVPAVASTASAADLALRFLSAESISDKDQHFTEPSGLTFGPRGELWSVSDDTGALFRLEVNGAIARRLELGGKTDGLEGVAWNEASGRFLVVREQSSEILEIDPARPLEVVRHSLTGMEGFASIAGFFSGDGSNNGLEGIEVVPDSGAVFVVKESHPRLMLELSPDLTAIRGALILSAELGFVTDEESDRNLDVSDIAWDPGRRMFWITSDTGRCLFLFDPATQKARVFALLWNDGERSRAVHEAEGVALSSDGQTLSIVSDDGRHSRLYRYQVE